VSRICLQKLPKLTSIDIIDLALEPTVLFDFLKLFPHLRLVKVCTFDNSRDEDDKAVPEEKKLVVSELSLDRGDFWRIFRVDHLKKLEISVCMFITEENVNTFCGVVGRGQRLEFLEDVLPSLQHFIFGNGFAAFELDSESINGEISR